MTTSKRLWRDSLLLNKNVDEGLHGFHFFIRNQPVVFGNSDEMDETHVKDVMFVNVPERVEPMSMVEMCVATEHLLHDTLTVLVESLVKTTGFADPFSGSVHVEIRGLDFIKSEGIRQTIHFVSWKHDWVMDLANDPFLHAVDEFGRGNFGSAAIHKPSVCQAK